MKKFKPYIIGSIVFALLILIAGLNKPFISPFTSTINFTDVDSVSKSKDGMVIADAQRKRIMFADAEDTIRKFVEFDRKESPFDRVSNALISGDKVFVSGYDVYNQGNYISSEKIAVYDLNGKYIETIYELPVESDTYISNFGFKRLNAQNGRLQLIYSIDNNVTLLEYSETDEDMTTVASWTLDENVYHAFFSLSGNRIIAISRSQHVYLMDISSGSVQTVTFDEVLSDIEPISECIGSKVIDADFLAEHHMSSITYEGEAPSYVSLLRNDGTSVHICDLQEKTAYKISKLPVSAWLRISGFLHYFAIIWLVGMLLLILIYAFVKKSIAKKSIVIITIVVLVAITAFFYTVSAYQQVKQSFSSAAMTNSNIANLVVSNMLLPQQDIIRSQGAESYCLSDDNQPYIDNLQTQLENVSNATGVDASLYNLVFLCDTDGNTYSLLDSRRIFYSGIPLGNVIDISSTYGPSPDTIVFRSTPYGDSYSVYSYIYADDGSVLGVVVTAFLADNLIAQQSDLALTLFINLSTILIVLYMSASLVSVFTKDFKRRKARPIDDFDNRSADIAGLYVFVNSVASSLDGVILVFVAQSLCLDMDPLKAAAMAAIPLTACSLGNWLGTFFANPLSKKFGDKRLSYFSALCSIGSMLLCIFSIQISSILVFSLGKFLVNLFSRGFIYVLGETIPYNSSNDDTRRSAMASTKEAAYAAGIISTLAGGYISLYLSYSAIYMLGAILTVPLLFITPMVFTNKSKVQAEVNSSILKESKNAWKFWFTKDMLMYVIFYMLPRTLMSGYNSYLLPLYTSGAGISELLLSNMSVYSRTLTYSLNPKLKKLASTYSHTLVMISAQMIIAGILILFIISPNVYWALIAMFLISICSQLTINVATLFVGDTAESMGYEAKTEVSNYYTVFSAVGCVKSSVLSVFLSLGINMACASLGLVTGAMITVYTLYLKLTGKIKQSASSD